MTLNPDRMYPLDADDAEMFDSFAELREAAEPASDSLNLPLSWYFDTEKESWSDDDWEPTFTLMFLSPRKNRSWGMQCRNFDPAEVKAWLDTWLKGEIDEWFGWTAALPGTDKENN